MTRQLDYFDLEQREGGRQALFQYMARQGPIGVPALANRINEFLDGKGRVPQKTLQRFLANEKNTNPMAVSLIMRFAERCNASDVVQEAGRGLSAFYNSKRKQDYSGTYEGSRYDDKLTLHIREGDIYWRVKARCEGKDNRVLQGVMVDVPDGALATFRDMLTGLPASYVISKRTDQLTVKGYFTPRARAFPGGPKPPLIPEHETFSLSKVKADAL